MLRIDSCIVYQDIQPTIIINDIIENLFNVMWLCYIQLI